MQQFFRSFDKRVLQLVASSITFSLCGVFSFTVNVYAESDISDEPKADVETLMRELEETQMELKALQSDIGAGPVSIGGLMRVNYVRGDYETDSSGASPGSSGGNVMLDTFGINMNLEHARWTGKIDYRFYDGYNFLHTAWAGYSFNKDDELQIGVTRVPFGPTAYGVSASWFFDQHYYVGLADDMDFGVLYSDKKRNWRFEAAYFLASEGHWTGASEDSARYSYDVVKWRNGLDQDGNVIAAPVNGYEERHQLNVRLVYSLSKHGARHDIGLSAQYGQLDGIRTEDGDHWAGSLHMINELNSFTVISQVTRYEINIDMDNELGTDKLVPMGAYDFAWPVATKAWLPAISLRYQYNTPQLLWLEYVMPYIEYSNIIKDAAGLNDSRLFVLGAAWKSAGWLIYSDLAFSDGNFFVGNKGDDYSNVFDGVGDLGANGNNVWNYRFNINFGYYF